MPPELATHPNPDRTADPPLLSLVEWAVAELDAFPTEPGHCHICGMLPGVLHRTEETEDSMHRGARRPKTLADLHGDAYRAALAVFGVNGVRSREWGPAVAAAVRQLARDLDTSAWCAENP